VSLFTGVHVVDTALFERLPAGASDSVRDLYAPLVGAGGFVAGVRVSGAWYDLGDPAHYLAAQQRLLRRARKARLLGEAVRLAPRAHVTASVVGPGGRVEAGARVLGSVLWEDVWVGARATVRRAVLGEGVRVAPGERIEGQVVTRQGRRPL
jgi:mannose-1-phosphate guanylyltransferase